MGGPDRGRLLPFFVGHMPVQLKHRRVAAQVSRQAAASGPEQLEGRHGCPAGTEEPFTADG